MENLINILVVVLHLLFWGACMGLSMFLSVLYMLAYTLVPLCVLYFLLKHHQKTHT